MGDDVNAVRVRAGLTPLSGVTNAQVIDEKFAELAMEWGTRFYDMGQRGKFDELIYDGRTFSEDKIFYPYPQAQVNLNACPYCRTIMCHSLKNYIH